MSESRPQVIVIGGSNGAGKTTAAQTLLRGSLRVPHFVNADWIAQGLSAFEPERVALEAGRVMLMRLKELARSRISFAFETTLASRSFAPWLHELCDSGYRFALLYLWLPDPEQSVMRVAQRVSQGGHGVPEETVRRRYAAGLHNFFELYQPLTSRWGFFDNSLGTGPRLLARGHGKLETAAYDTGKWAAIRQTHQRMKPDDQTDLDSDADFDEGGAIDADLKAAVREAVRRHKLLGQPIVEWRDGRVVLTPPEEIVIDDEPADERH